MKNPDTDIRGEYEEFKLPDPVFRPKLSVEEGILYALRTGKMPSQLGTVDLERPPVEDFTYRAARLARQQHNNT